MAEHVQASTVATAPTASQLVLQWDCPKSIKVLTAMPIPSASHPIAKSLRISLIVIVIIVANTNCTGQIGLCLAEVLSDYP